jgi:hypoxanthine phosphoribosyltransferase
LSEQERQSPALRSGKTALPRNYVLCYSAESIAASVTVLAREISEWAAAVRSITHTDILAVPVLRGGIFFFADLMRQVQGSVEVSPARARAYHSETNELRADGRVDIVLDEAAARGRSVLLVDDICDSGVSLREFTAHLGKLGVREVKSVVLIRRVIEQPTFTPDWIGFNHRGPEWFVGYGMDDSDRWSNLPDIYVIQKVIES